MALLPFSKNMFESLAELRIDDEEDRSTSVASTSGRVSKNNTQSSHEEGQEKDEEEEEGDFEDEIIHSLFGLEALGGHAKSPTFTRGLLQQIASDVSYITTMQSGLSRNRAVDSLYRKCGNGTVASIWKKVDGANDITVNYMTRVEMSAQFQSRFGNDWKRTKPFRALNANLSQRELNDLAAPYYLQSFCRKPDKTHLDAPQMDWWHNRLRHTQSLWKNSSSCHQLCRLVQDGAARFRAPITKIVCIGLGELASSPAFYQSAIQHMTAFSFAETLDRFNRTGHSDSPPVKIIAQDPCYKECDRILLQELTGNQIDFSLSDPETLLSIDANTIVITAFLPHTVPLMQILADLFAGQREQGPAMILCDRLMNPDEKTKWCLRNRDQPGVAGFLVGGYIRYDKKFVGLEEELIEDLSDGKKSCRYWLDDMILCLRQDTALKK